MRKAEVPTLDLFSLAETIRAGSAMFHPITFHESKHGDLLIETKASRVEVRVDSHNRGNRFSVELTWFHRTAAGDREMVDLLLSEFPSPTTAITRAFETALLPESQITELMEHRSTR